MNDVTRFPTDASAPPREPDAARPGVVRALPTAEDPMALAARDILLGASAMGFVGVVLIGIQPRGAGVAVICSSGLDAMKTIGALEVAKSDLIRQMHMGQRQPPPMPPNGGEPERKL